MEIKFNNTCTTWGETCYTWGQCIAEVAEIVEGGARNPQEWGDHPYDLYDQQQKELMDYQRKNPQKKSKLIEILVKCGNKKYKKSIELSNKDIFIKVEDVHFILNEARKVGVDVKNIRKYTDDELQNLLRQR